jgi:hypothetical protein
MGAPMGNRNAAGSHTKGTKKAARRIRNTKMLNSLRHRSKVRSAIGYWNGKSRPRYKG